MDTNSGFRKTGVTPKKIRIAVPYTNRLFSFPNIGFRTLAEALWNAQDDSCEIVKLPESDLPRRDDYDVVFLIRKIGTDQALLDHFAKTGKRIAIWVDDLHCFYCRVPCASERLICLFDKVDLIFTPYYHQFHLWKLYRRFVDKVVWSPWSVPDWIFEDSVHWKDRRDRVLLSGCCSVQYPLRKRLFQYAHGSDCIDILDHPGYAGTRQKGVVGREFYKLLSSYKGAIATTGSTRLRIKRVIDYTVHKYFEIPACGCVPFMEVTPDLGELGFVDGLNFISITRSNYQKRLRFIHSREAEGLARASQNLIREKHTDKHRARAIIDSIVNLSGNS